MKFLPIDISRGFHSILLIKFFGLYFKKPYLPKFFPKSALKLLAIFLMPAYYQLSAQDEAKKLPLSLHHIAFSTSFRSLGASPPSFNSFAQDFEGGSNFTVRLDDPYSEVEFNPRYSYLGFHVQFMFKPTFFKSDDANERNLFSIAFESGTSSAEYYRLELNNQYYSYVHSSGNFGLTLGYRRLLTKPEKRFKFFAAIEWTHEFKISPVVREDEKTPDFSKEISSRKFFDDTSYNFYLFPSVGMDWRFAKKLSVFYQFQMGLGHQNNASIKVNDLFVGGKFGLAFRL